MIVLHHLENSRSQRVLWCLEELGLSYEIAHHKRDPVTKLACASLKVVHPLGRAPVLEVDGQLMVESGAILETLADAHGDGLLLPDTAEQRAAYRLWMHFAEGSAMPPLYLSLLFKMIPRQPMPFLVRPVARKLSDTIQRRIVWPQLKTNATFIEEHLSRNEWFAGGKFTAADIQMSFPCQAMAARGKGSSPHIAAFVARIEARPAYKAALERGGPFSILS